MKLVKMLYVDTAHLTQFLQQNEFDLDHSWLVRIHASTPDKELCHNIAKQVKDSIPHATVIGCTVSGVIFDGTIYDDKTLLIFSGFERATITSDFFSFKDMSINEISNRLIDVAKDLSPALAIIHFGGMTLHSEGVVRTISKQLPNVPFVGGIAGCQDTHGNVISSVFDENGAYEQTLSITYISNDFVLAYTNAIVGHAPISELHTITSMTDDYINEIDGVDSVEWINDQLGTTHLRENTDYEATVSTDILLRFPFVIEGHNGASRFVQFDASQNKLRQYFSQLELDTQFRIGYVSPIKSVEEWQNLCYDLQNTPVETMFCYSCLFRKLFLNNLSKWEMNPFKGQEVCGAFMFGEIGTKNGNTYYYNGTCAIFTMAEKVHYIRPDLRLFDKIEELDDTNSEITQTLKNLISLSDNSETFTLFENAIKNEERAIDRMQAGSDTMGMFLRQRELGKSLKICVVKINSLIENASHKLMNEMRNYANASLSKLALHFYHFDENSFFFATDSSISDMLFTNSVKKLFDNFKLLAEETTIIDFAITLHGKSPRELLDYINQFADNQGSSFFNCDNNSLKENNLQQEFKIVEIIQTALNSDRVIPYFQGIYDSQANRFFAYEALMRLQTANGEILPPGAFLEISKKHDLYLDLSRAMICKVLDLFADRSEIISINISALDINSPEFTATIYEKFNKMENPGHFIFELVETEKFAGQESLRKFIRKVRQYGVKIAIDDFGSGYSNFIEIGNLEIDYIKINGSLTELLGTDTSYDQILESIFFLSEKMQVELIAESVETAAMQKNLVNHGIRYSQGFLFSRPMPIEQLYIVAEENKVQKSNPAEEKHTETFLGRTLTNKSKTRSFIWAGIATSLLFFMAVFAFSTKNLATVQEINDTFLVELATNMSDKISSLMQNSENLLKATNIALFSHYPDIKSITSVLERFSTLDEFDNIYITADDLPPQDKDGNVLVTDTPLSRGKIPENEVLILPPVTEVSSGRKIFALATSFTLSDSRQVTIYGIYYLDNFSSVLQIKSFGGEAFYHLCQIDGVPLILSGNNDNLFVDGDMYSFIGSLDILNGHTPQSLREDMENGKTSLLKYKIGNTQRTAVMVTVPETNWCVVSIILDDVTTQMADTINVATYFFTSFIITIYAIYLFFAVYTNRKTENRLKKALESSYYLTNSLQSTIETDTLTNTFTRATAQEKISEILQLCEQENSTHVHTLMIADVDNFKQINDHYGHQVGDTYLLEFVSAVKSSLRLGDIVGRLGGDEFIIMLNNIASKENAESIINKIIENINAISIKNVNLDIVGISVGAVMVPEYSTDYMILNNMADKALYEAKHKGKSTYVFHEVR